ncbi:MAG TPA: aminotransferase class I/II-fold pyridoxal phosphate-dependent enzyme [Vicinamibacterales bacterium]|nr:aminotransferase class I/II-fold pyridoxal phosphate-dependent enzyme [Vicinamibacterales bacterium]
MDVKDAVSRRKFVGGLAAAVGYVSTGAGLDVFAQGRGAGQDRPAGAAAGRGLQTEAEYDSLAKLANNENNFGIPDSVMKAMTDHWKYAGRYGYPNAGLQQAIADYDGVKAENVLLSHGSGEILTIVGTALLAGGKKVLGVEPSYNSVYAHATNIKAEAIKLPLTKDYRQDMAMMIEAAKKHEKEIGFVYLCNPNNPTGVIVTKQEIKQLLDALPAGMPVLIDEAYHHYVTDPNYATSMPYVNEGRPVIVARTFSKIAAMAALRVGYAVSTPELLSKMRTYQAGVVNVLAQYGAVAALKDKAAMESAKVKTVALREKATKDLKALGYEVIPSQTNFFMVGLRREVQPVITAFREEGVLVGRPFPPMTQHLRVSVGTAEEMDRFMVAFKKIMTAPTTTAQAK